MLRKYLAFRHIRTIDSKDHKLIREAKETLSEVFDTASKIGKEIHEARIENSNNQTFEMNVGEVKETMIGFMAETLKINNGDYKPVLKEITRNYQRGIRIT